MRKLLLIVVGLLVMLTNNVKVVQADSNEMRGVWITTVYNQDWPNAGSKNNVQAQKNEFINILNDINSIGINTIMIQVRPKGDALYKSNINPWSDVLTGVQGKDPGYDPLAFIIDEAHKRGIKVHAWLNPYRVTTSGTDVNSLSENHFARKNPQVVCQYNNGLFYNPGLPEVRQHIVDTVAEIVTNYNVDGIHFDDYFYPGNNVNDGDAYNKYGNGQDIGDFRRNSVNQMIKDVYNKIKSIKSNVEFGVSPRGIWKNKSSDPTGSDTRGAQSYYDIYADTRTWIKNQWLDYVVPQVYWEIGHSAADYSKLIPWWANEVANTNVDLYIGHAIYKTQVASEIEKQISLNKQHNVGGSVFYSYRDIRNNVEGVKNQLVSIYKGDTTIPPSTKTGVVYKTHVQDQGWQEWSGNGELSGTVGKAKRIEGIRLLLNGVLPEASISYRTHIEGIGWQSWKKDGEFSGTQGQGKRLEAIEINLENTPDYSIQYRVHVQDIGWQEWKSNGELAGTTGLAKRIEAVEIKLVENNIDDNGGINVAYQTHIQDVGWQSIRYNGQISGTTGHSKRLEAININIDNLPQGANIKYTTHVQDYGWQQWVNNGMVSGTSGQAKRLEAIKIELENLPGYSIQYRVHIQNVGWQEWKEDGQLAGTTGQAKRLEAIEIKVVRR